MPQRQLGLRQKRIERHFGVPKSKMEKMMQIEDEKVLYPLELFDLPSLTRKRQLRCCRCSCKIQIHQQHTLLWPGKWREKSTRES